MKSSILGALCATVLAATSAIASDHNASHKRFHHAKRDASTLMSGGNNNEGEAHGKVDVPSGADLTRLTIGKGPEQVATFWTTNPNNEESAHAYVMIHGKLRNGGEYWTTMNDAVTSAVKDNYAGASKDDIVVAPQFYSTKYNSGQYKKNELAFGDVNGWQAGDPATHPDGTTLTSFDALDAYVDEFADASKYPAMKNLTFVGHGGGGQLLARYAQVAKDPPSNLHIRYIMGDPSSNSYFTTDRPTFDGSNTKVSDCEYYNTWRYGYDNFTGTANGKQTPQEYFQKYIRRDVVSIVGLQDTAASGDTYCMAEMQGGTKRRDRNLCWYQYIHSLGRTDEQLTGFPCTYNNLPDWSNLSQNVVSLRLTVVENADHDAAAVFGSSEGRSVLFDSGNVVTGWRPDGWKASTKVVVPGAVNYAASGNNSTTSSRSSSSSSSSGSGSGSTSSKQQTSSATAISIGAFTALASTLLCASLMSLI
ncbi:unnamed protein product [Sympodiomycopsis kandeliae]